MNTMQKLVANNLGIENLYPFVNQPAELKECWLTDLLKEANKDNPNPDIWKLDPDTKEGKFDKQGNFHPNRFNHGIFDETFHSDTYKTGKYKSGGWIFDFSKSWKKYLVKYKYNESWEEQKAPNKSFIRNHSSCPSRILKIIEVKDNEEYINKNNKLIKKVINNYEKFNKELLINKNITIYFSKDFLKTFNELLNSLEELKNVKNL